MKIDTLIMKWFSKTQSDSWARAQSNWHFVGETYLKITIYAPCANTAINIRRKVHARKTDWQNMAFVTIHCVYLLFLYFNLSLSLFSGHISVGMRTCPKNTEKGTWDVVNTIRSVRLRSVGWLGRCRRYGNWWWRKWGNNIVIESTSSDGQWKGSS